MDGLGRRIAGGGVAVVAGAVRVVLWVVSGLLTVVMWVLALAGIEELR